MKDTNDDTPKTGRDVAAAAPIQSPAAIAAVVGGAITCHLLNHRLF
jgi:hypothetical protein